MLGENRILYLTTGCKVMYLEKMELINPFDNHHNKYFRQISAMDAKNGR